MEIKMMCSGLVYRTLAYLLSGTTGFEPMIRTPDYQTRKPNLGTQDNKSHVIATTFIIDM